MQVTESPDQPSARMSHSKNVFKIPADERPQICFDVNQLADSVWTRSFKTYSDVFKTTGGKLDWDVPRYLPIWDVTAGSVNLSVPQLLNKIPEGPGGFRLSLTSPAIVRTEETWDDDIKKERYYLTFKFSLPIAAQQAMGWIETFD